jgi:thiol:disulfide interchange protein
MNYYSPGFVILAVAAWLLTVDFLLTRNCVELVAAFCVFLFLMAWAMTAEREREEKVWASTWRVGKRGRNKP